MENEEESFKYLTTRTEKRCKDEFLIFIPLWKYINIILKYINKKKISYTFSKSLVFSFTRFCLFSGFKPPFKFQASRVLMVSQGICKLVLQVAGRYATDPYMFTPTFNPLPRHKTIPCSQATSHSLLNIGRTCFMNRSLNTSRFKHFIQKMRKKNFIGSFLENPFISY